MNKKAKVITICGSLKFKDEMIKSALKLELEENVVLMPIFPVDGNKDSFSDEQFNMLGKMHKEKINLSDAIFVVNVGGYIGSSTKSEIEYAKEHNKEIIYLENNNI